MANNKLAPFDKYQYYQWAVQSPEADIEFLLRMYKKYRLEVDKKTTKKVPIKQLPLHLREDFCGTALLCSEWLSASQQFTAEGFDIDDEPIQWGVQHNFADVDNWPDRMQFMQQDVANNSIKAPNIRIAQNFSYCIFKTREQMKEYLSHVYNDLAEDGLFVMDVHGGSESYMAMEEETVIEAHGFSYFWDQDEYYPVTGEVLRKIHFKRKGQKKVMNVFTYDWRMWTIPELVELLNEAGFAQVDCFWEGTDSDGVSGNGVFKKSKKGSNDLSWVSYLVAAK